MHGKAAEDGEVCPGCTHTIITPNDQNFVNAAKDAFQDLYRKAKGVADELMDGLFLETEACGCPAACRNDHSQDSSYREPLLSAHAPHTPEGMQSANVTLKNAASKYAFWGIRAITHALSGMNDLETGAKAYNLTTRPCDDLIEAIEDIEFNLACAPNGQVQGGPFNRVVIIYPTCDEAPFFDFPSVDGVEVNLWPAPPNHKFKEAFAIAADFHPFVFSDGHIRLEQNGDVLDVVASPRFAVKRPWAISKFSS